MVLRSYTPAVDLPTVLYNYISCSECTKGKPICVQQQKGSDTVYTLTFTGLNFCRSQILAIFALLFLRMQVLVWLARPSQVGALSAKGR